MESTDAELVDNVLGGDVDAFKALFERHWSMAIGVAFSICRDRQFAEDAAQEAFAIAAAKLSGLRDHEQFAAWLCVICRRTSRRVADRQKPFAHLEWETAARSDTGRSDAAQSDAAPDRLGIDLSEALSVMRAQEREILTLHYYSGLSHDQIAVALDTTASAVHGRLQRARKRLREILNSKIPGGVPDVRT